MEHPKEKPYGGIVGSGVTRGARGHLPPTVAVWGHQNWDRNITQWFKKCQMSADTNNYNLQNVKCQRVEPSCEISSRSPRYAKRAVTNFSDILRQRFCQCLQQSAATQGWQILDKEYGKCLSSLWQIFGKKILTIAILLRILIFFET